MIYIYYIWSFTILIFTFVLIFMTIKVTFQIYQYFMCLEIYQIYQYFVYTPGKSLTNKSSCTLVIMTSCFISKNWWQWKVTPILTSKFDG